MNFDDISETFSLLNGIIGNTNTLVEQFPFTNKYSHFSSSFSNNSGIKATARGDWIPKMNLISEKDRYILTADIPDVKRENMEVVVDKSRVCIKGKRLDPYKNITSTSNLFDFGGYSSENNEAESTFILREVPSGSFERCIEVQDKLDEKNVNATYTEGLLSISIPKVEKTEKYTGSSISIQ